MEIVGRYYDSGIELEGTAEALRHLSRLLRENDGDVQPLKTLASPPSPYSGYLRSLLVRRGTGQVRVSQEGDEVIISGDPRKLEVLARNVERLASDHDSAASDHDRHFHAEYHPGHFYLDEKSIPVVIAKKEAW